MLVAGTRGIAFAVTLAAVAMLVGSAHLAAEDMVGKVAPDFKITEWINGTGKTSLKDCEGQLVLIKIWATW